MRRVTALIIIAAILAFFCFILFLQVKLVIKFDGQPEIVVKVLGIPFKLVPRKKKIKLRAFSAKKYRRMLLRDEENARKAEEKKRLKDAEKKAKKEAEKAEKKRKKEEGIKELEANPIKVLLRIVFKVLARFARHIRIDVFKIRISVGGSDATAVAMLYGVLSQSVWYVAEALDQVVHFKLKGERDISVFPDYLSGKLEADIHVAVRLRVIHVLDTALFFLIGFVKTKLAMDAELRRKNGSAVLSQTDSIKKSKEKSETR